MHLHITRTGSEIILHHWGRQGLSQTPELTGVWSVFLAGLFGEIPCLSLPSEPWMTGRLTHLPGVYTRSGDPNSSPLTISVTLLLQCFVCFKDLHCYFFVRACTSLCESTPRHAGAQKVSIGCPVPLSWSYRLLWATQCGCWIQTQVLCKNSECSLLLSPLQTLLLEFAIFLWPDMDVYTWEISGVWSSPLLHAMFFVNI